MAKPRLQRTEGIVIRHCDFGEADKLLTLYTPFAGKVRAIAKGARRSTSKLSGHVELLAHSQLLIAKGRSLDIVTQSETLHAFIGLRADLRRTNLACYVAELLDRLTAEHVENQPVFALMLETLLRIDAGRRPEIAVRLFEMQLLGHLGYRPQLYHCIQCNGELGPAANCYSPVGGGVHCGQCTSDAPSRPITESCFKVLRLLQAGDFATASRLRLDVALRFELDAVLRSQISSVLEGELKSVAVLRSIG